MHLCRYMQLEIQDWDIRDIYDACLASNHITFSHESLSSSTQHAVCSQSKGTSTNLLNVTSSVLRSLSSGGLSMSKCQTSIGSESGMNMLSARGVPAAHDIQSIIEHVSYP